MASFKQHEKDCLDLNERTKILTKGPTGILKETG